MPSYLKSGEGFYGNSMDDVFLFNEREEIVFKYR